MGQRYTYNLKGIAVPSSMSKAPALANVVPFAYNPTVTVMDAYEANHNSPIPTQSMLLCAKERAECITTEKDPVKEAADEARYHGIPDHRHMTSRELRQTAETLHPNDVPLFFDDFLTAEYYRGALRKNKRVEDSTIPKTVVAMKLHVDILVRAFKSTHDCADNPHMVQPFRERRHDGKLIECLCWSIVKAIIYRSKSDEPLLTAYEPYKAKGSGALDNFEKRFDAVATAMMRSKTICKHLFDAPYINTFVDDPLRSVRRVDANRDLNRQKADVMKKGKALQNHFSSAPGAKKSKKRSASAAGMQADDDEGAARMRTPGAQVQASSYAVSQSAPVGRVTRRSSRMMNMNQVSPQTESTIHTPIGTPSATPGTPYGTPVAVGRRGIQYASSPLSNYAEVKDESSPLGQEQSYFDSRNGSVPVSMVYGNPYAQAFTHNFNYGPRPQFTSMGPGYPYAGMNHQTFMHGSHSGHVASTNAMGYRNAPMQTQVQPEEVTMPASVSSSPPDLPRQD